MIKYGDHRNNDKLTKEEIRSITALLILYLRYLSTIELTAYNTEITVSLWKFIFTSRGFRAQDTNVTMILESFQYFCGKAGPIVEHFESVITLLPYLSEIRIENLDDTNLCTLIGICRSLFNYIGSNDTEKVSSIIKCIDDFNPSCSTPQRLVCEFCCDILRFSICHTSTSPSDLVSKCLSHLQSISLMSRLLMSHAFYFASVILMQLRHYWITDTSFYTSCIQNTFKFLLALSTKMLSVDISQVMKTKSVNMPEQFYTIYVANFILSLTYRAQDLDSATLKNLYSQVYEAMEICLIVYDEKCTIDAKQKYQLHNSIGNAPFTWIYFFLHILIIMLQGAGCVNVCRTFIIAELYAESKELSLMAAQKISVLPSSQLSDSILQVTVSDWLKQIKNIHNKWSRL